MRFTINAGFDWVDVRDVCEAQLKALIREHLEKAILFEVSGHRLGSLSNNRQKIEKITHWVSLPFWTVHVSAICIRLSRHW